MSYNRKLIIKIKKVKEFQRKYVQAKEYIILMVVN